MTKTYEPKSKSLFTDWCEAHGYEKIDSPLLAWYVESYPARLYRREGRRIYRMRRSKWHITWEPVKLPQWAKSFLSISAYYGNPSLTGFQWAALCRGIYEDKTPGRGWVANATVTAALSRWTSRPLTWTRETPRTHATVSYTPSPSGVLPVPDYVPQAG